MSKQVVISPEIDSKLNSLLGKSWMYKLEIYFVKAWVRKPHMPLYVTIHTDKGEISLLTSSIEKSIENFLPVSREEKKRGRPKTKIEEIPMEKPKHNTAIVVDRDELLKEIIEYKNIVKKNIDEHRKENDMVSVKLFNDSVRTYVDLVNLQVKLRELKINIL